MASTRHATLVYHCLFDNPLLRHRAEFPIIYGAALLDQ
jgi:hypothetical protein